MKIIFPYRDSTYVYDFARKTLALSIKGETVPLSVNHPAVQPVLREAYEIYDEMVSST